MQPQSFGAYLRYLRLGKGLTPAEASRRAGLKGRGRWYELEAGEQKTKEGSKPTLPSIQQLLAIVDGLEVSDADAQTLFALAGFGDVWKGIGRRASRMSAKPATVEEGIEADPRLAPTTRRLAKELVHQLMRAQAAPPQRDAEDADSTG